MVIVQRFGSQPVLVLWLITRKKNSDTLAKISDGTSLR
jgi:hypothetical protein